MRSRSSLVAVLLILAACPAPQPHHPTSPPTVKDELARVRAVVAAHPERNDARRELGFLTWLAGDRAGALPILAEAVKHDPEDARALWVLAMAQDAAADDAAGQSYRTLASMASARPGDPWAQAAGVQAVDWLDERAVFEGDEAATQLVRSLEDSPSPAIRAAALDSRRYRNRGDAATLAAGWRLRRGCAPSWVLRQVTDAAPHLPLLAPAGKGPHESAADPRKLDAPFCRVVVRPERRRPASIRLDTFLEVEREQEVELELYVDDIDVPARLWVGDTLVVGRDATRRFLPKRLRARVALSPGVSTVSLELASLGDAFVTEVVVRDPKTGARPEGVRWADDAFTRPAGVHAPIATFVGASSDPMPPVVTMSDGLLADVLLFERALDRADSDAAGEALDRVLVAAPDWPAAYELLARLARARAAQPRPLAHDAARRAYLRALELDPGALRARLDLAEQLLDDDDGTQALGVLGEGEKPMKVPGAIVSWRADLVRSTVLADKGREAESDAAAERALAARPGACAARAASYRLLRREGKLDAARKAATDVIACDGWSTVLASVESDAGDLGGVLLERRRLAARDPEDAGAKLDVARAELALGHREPALAAAADALALDPWESRTWLLMADILAARGQLKEARTTLETALARNPSARELAQALTALGGADEIEPWRIDGKEVIRAFEADEKSGARPPYAAPAVVILDRTVVIVHADGSRLTLTHNVVKMLQKDGLDRWGELPIPAGAEILKARTIKADGRIREPQSLGKEGLTAPDLAVGDYVEFEYLTVSGDSPAWRGGFTGDRFYFSSFDAPLDRTEMIVVAPEGYPLEFDVRGEAPAPRVERRSGLVVTTFGMRRREQLQPEPGGPPADEWLPSAQPYAHVSLAGWRAWVGGQVYGLRRADREVRQTALELSRGRSPRQAAQAIYDFVLDEIDDTGALADEPTTILARRQGRRAVLFVALADAAGLDASLWLARPRSAGDGPPTRIDTADLAYALVRLRLPDGDVLVDLRNRYAPLGYLDPSLRGVSMIEIPDPSKAPAAGDAEPKLATTPATPLEPDERDVELDIQLGADGSAEVAGKEVMTGLPAAMWRDYLKDTPMQEIEKDLEQRALGFYFPGAALEHLELGAREDPGVPFVVSYRFRVPRFARPADGGALVVPASTMPAFFGRRYLTTGSRSTALVMSEEGATRVTAKIHPPAGLAPRSLPAAVDLQAPRGAGRFRHACVVKDDAVACASETAMTPWARVAPGDYEAFERFAATADADEAGTITLEPR